MQSPDGGKSHAVCGATKRDGTPCPARPMPNGRCRMHGGKAGRPIETGKYSRYSVIRSKDAAALRAHFEADPDPLNLLPDVLELRVRIADFCNRYDEITGALLAWHSAWGPGWEAREQAWQGEYSTWAAGFAEVAELVGGIREETIRAGCELLPPPPPPSPEDLASKPRRMVDILQAGQFLTAVGTLVEKIHKRQQERGLSLVDIDDILKRHGLELMAAAGETIKDDDLRKALLAAVSDRWDAIPIAIDRSKAA